MLEEYVIQIEMKKVDLKVNSSGTTGIAAKLLNRNFIGMELSSEYMTIAKERIKNFQESKKKK